jgi:hypothetical protein
MSSINHIRWENTTLSDAKEGNRSFRSLLTLFIVKITTKAVHHVTDVFSYILPITAIQMLMMMPIEA